MTSALIGHTGFVGGNLARAHRFDHHFNSRNFRDMAGRRFDLAVCAGLTAAKWLANRDPSADWSRIAALADILARVDADKFMLISTIDVYPEPVDVDETTAIDIHSGHAYGRHRLKFERFVAERFPGSQVLRLPALFGPGLKKNVLFDLINGQLLDAINPDSRFQWYDIAGLWRDIERFMASGMLLANLVTEPIATRDILTRYFPDRQVGAKAAAVVYDVGTVHAGLFGGRGRYVRGGTDVLEQIGAYLRSVSAKGAA